MRKWMIVGGVLVVLSGLVALALWNLNGLVARNKDYLLAQVEQALGRKVAVGEIGLSLWGGIGVRVRGFALADDPAFSRDDFLRAEDLQVNVKFLPLLWKELRISRLILRKPAITVIRDQRGTFNFASLGRPGEAGKGKGGQATEGTEAAPSATTRAVPLFISLLDVADGEVRYLDKKDGSDLRASRVDVRLEDLGADRPVPVTVAAAALGAKEQSLKIRARLGPLQGAPALSAVPLEANIEISSLNLETVRHALPLAGFLPAGFGADGPFSLKANAKGTLQDLALAGTADASASAVRWGAFLAKPQGVPLVLSLEGRVSEKKIALKLAKLHLHTLQLTGTGEMDRGPRPAVRLRVDATEAKVDGWENILAPLRGYGLSGRAEIHAALQGEMGTGKVPRINGTLSLAGVRAKLPFLPNPLTDLNATLTFTGDRAELAETVARLGNSPVRVAAQVQRFSPLSLTYRLSSPELALAHLRAGGPVGKRPEVLREVKSEGSVRAENGALAAQAKLASGRGTLADMDYTDLQTGVSVGNRVVTVERLSLRAFGGSLQASGRYDPREASPRFTVRSRVQGLELSQFVRAMFPAAPQNIRGKANLDLQLAGRGTRWEEIRQTLEGQGKGEVVKGALANVNIAEGVLSGVTGIAGLTRLVSPRVRERYPEIFTTQDTTFDQLKGSATIREGKVQTEDVVIAAADYLARGRGWFALDGALDVRGVLSLSKRVSDDIVTEVREGKYLLNDQGRLEVPFTLAGTWPRPTPKPDLEYVARALVQRGALKKGEEEIEKALRKRLPEGLLRSPEPPPQRPGDGPPSPPETGPQEKLRKGLDRLWGR